MKKKFMPSDFVGKQVRLHSSMWEQGWCDGEVVGYDPVRMVWWFRPSYNTRQDDPLYGVRIEQKSQLALL